MQPTHNPGRQPSDSISNLDEQKALVAEIVLAAGDLSGVPEGLSKMKVVHHPKAGRVKVRAYHTVEQARRIEEHLRQLSGKIPFPPLLGRQERFLLFEYLDLEPREAGRQEPETLFAIGQFLGTLNQEPAADSSPAELDEEFAGWMARFQALQILPGRLARKGEATYRDLRPGDLPLCLDHWDAMPHNFGWWQETLHLMDEKHLRPSFPGVGLVKPLFLLSPGAWHLLLSGYEETTPVDFFHRRRPFLEFYYLAAALYFYSLIGQAGRVRLVSNYRYLDYRDAFIRRLSSYTAWDGWRGELALYRANPAAIPGLVRRRLYLLAGRKSAPPEASDLADV